MTDRFCPLGFILCTTFFSLLVWLYALVNHIALR